LQTVSHTYFFSHIDNLADKTFRESRSFKPSELVRAPYIIFTRNNISSVLKNCVAICYSLLPFYCFQTSVTIYT